MGHPCREQFLGEPEDAPKAYKERRQHREAKLDDDKAMLAKERKQRRACHLESGM